MIDFLRLSLSLPLTPLCETPVCNALSSGVACSASASSLRQDDHLQLGGGLGLCITRWTCSPCSWYQWTMALSFNQCQCRGSGGNQSQNNLHNETTSIHFHGIFQKDSNQMDGPAMVPQCPVPPGSCKLFLNARATSPLTDFQLLPMISLYVHLIQFSELLEITHKSH